MAYIKSCCRVDSYLYQKAPVPVELTVTEGLGNQPADFATQQRSVPCQSGCPVMTNVPGYFEKIAQGKHEDAYRINLEHNVLPGVLGRICVRPCQTECRHNWTDINGTVEICHLKRAAADRTAVKGAPLAPWFPDTGHRVAVIGGRPCHFDTDEHGVIQKAHPAESATETTFIWIDNKNCIR
jgi:NADPH-dependent glutamate synthase beta subunit-like oxidoreductase